MRVNGMQKIDEVTDARKDWQNENFADEIVADADIEF